jgi:hypothetical protein
LNTNTKTDQAFLLAFVAAADTVEALAMLLPRPLAIDSIQAHPCAAAVGPLLRLPFPMWDDALLATLTPASNKQGPAVAPLQGDHSQPPICSANQRG